MRTGLAFLVAGPVVALVATAAGGSPAEDTSVRARAAKQPRCFGAGARDPEHPCRNPRLRFSVKPKPRDALLTPNSRCAPIPAATGPQVCAFGLPATRARVAFALVGDSHAVHWRAALEVVARAKGWRGVSLDQTQCLFSRATTALRAPLAADCARWNGEVQRWLEVHPEVHTLFTSQHRGARVVVPPGGTQLETTIKGYIAAWNALPASVRRVVVIRDEPYDTQRTPACVERALARRRTPPGVACARSRRVALGPDPAVLAARRLASPRVRVIDMTRFMCDRRRCYPVVGGVLVHKDVGHLTRLFSTTLGPYVLRALNRLMASGR